MVNTRSTDIGWKVVNHITAMLAYWDKDEICRFANHAYLEWFGRSEDEMIDKMSMKELLGSELYEKNKAYIKNALRGETQIFEREIKTPSGELRYSLATYSPDWVDGKVAGFVAHVADIGAIKKLELSLQRSEKHFKSLLESAPDAVVIANEKGIIQLVNHQTEILFGYAKSEMIGQSIEILIPDRFKDGHKYRVQNYVLSPTTRSMAHEFSLYGKKKNGDEFHIEVGLSPTQTDEGLLIFSSMRDISERAEHQRKLVEAYKNLEILSERLTTQNVQLANFAHVTSHNLRSPVSNLNSLLFFYKTSTSEEDKSQLLEKLENVVHHLTSTLNVLVEALKVQEVAKEAREMIRLEDVLEKTRAMIAAQIMESGAEIHFDFARAPQVEYNRVYMESVFLNLLTNAIKYKHPHRAPEIIFRTEKINDEVVMSVRDNGLGIDLKKYGPDVFGLHKTFHLNPEAKGIGLFLTKTQVENMGGTIAVESEQGKGTVFTITF